VGPCITEGIKLNLSTYDAAGIKAVKDIWRSPGEFQNVNGFIEKRLPDGRGIRFQHDWTFKGFLD